MKPALGLVDSSAELQTAGQAFGTLFHSPGHPSPRTVSGPSWPSERVMSPAHHTRGLELVKLCARVCVLVQHMCEGSIRVVVSLTDPSLQGPLLLLAWRNPGLSPCPTTDTQQDVRAQSIHNFRDWPCHLVKNYVWA
jgi:hypothetical protein